MAGNWVIWRLCHSQVWWLILAVVWAFSWGCDQSTYTWLSMCPGLSHSMAAQRQLDFLHGSLGL